MWAGGRSTAGLPTSIAETEAVDEDQVTALVDGHRGRIAAALPGADTRLSGSTLLGLFAGHDIDLVVLVDDVVAAADVLRAVYPPLYEAEWRSDWAAFRELGPPQVDVVVTQRGTKGDAHHRRAWDLLLEDEELRAEYLQRKAAGMTGEEKRAFFERVVMRLPVDPRP